MHYPSRFDVSSLRLARTTARRRYRITDGGQLNRLLKSNILFPSCALYLLTLSLFLFILLWYFISALYPTRARISRMCVSNMKIVLADQLATASLINFSFHQVVSIAASPTITGRVHHASDMRFAIIIYREDIALWNNPASASYRRMFMGFPSVLRGCFAPGSHSTRPNLSSMTFIRFP